MEQITTKYCSKCKRELPVTAFNKNSKDKLQSQCRECHAEPMRQYIIKRGRKEEEAAPMSERLHKVYTNPELAKFKPRELMSELKARGYSGELTFVQRITI